MQELILGVDEAGQRFDKYLRKYLKQAPSSFIYKMLRKKNITLNGKKAKGSEITRTGDTVRFFLSDETLSNFHQDRTIERRAVRQELIPGVIFEDRHLLVLNKPAGLLSQPDRRKEAALTDWVLMHEEKKRGQGTGEEGTFVPAPVNRLDRNTSGIVLCGVSLQGGQWLSSIIRSGKLRKEYLVITKDGELPDGLHRAYGKKNPRTNTLEIADRRQEGYSELLTETRTLLGDGTLALRKVNLITGKPHQIRAHLSHMGVPAAGDRKYGDCDLNRLIENQYGIRRQLLHAFRVTFPAGDAEDEAEKMTALYGGRSFEAAVPEDMRMVLAGMSLHGAGAWEDKSRDAF